MSSSDEVSQRIAEFLIAPGYGWIDGFLDPDQARELRMLADERFAAGEFHAAGIGAGEVNFEIRRDQIQWVDREKSPEPLRRILDRYRALLPAINSTCYLGLKSVESMLAIYPSGAFYRRHRDRFRRKAHRVVSLVLYLNEHWTPEDGGELVIYPEPDGVAGGDADVDHAEEDFRPAEEAVERAGESTRRAEEEAVVEPAEKIVVVEPHAGRLVVFLSELEHEVRATTVPRYSLTAWLLDRPK